MSKRKIGIVTYYKDNYGSFLQCFSLCWYLRQKEFEPVVFVARKKSFIGSLVHKVIVLSKCALIPGFASNKFNIRKARQKESTLLNEKSKNLIDSCVEENLNVECHSTSELRKLSRTDEYKCFFAGSDQIWNSNSEIDEFKFLKFSPKHKNYGISVSFGSLAIPKYNLKKLKRLLVNFRQISLREESAVEFVYDLVNRKYPRTADPTLLLNKSNWEEFISKAKNDSTKSKSYIFVHFINEPSSVAVKCIQLLAERKKAKVLLVGYDHKLDLNYEFIDASPFEFLRLLNNSECVITDSFHSSLFSINFEKEFYTFERCYLHNYSQSSRIHDLLTRFNMADRFISNINDLNLVNSKVSSDKLIGERTKLEEYIDSCVKGE